MDMNFLEVIENFVLKLIACGASCSKRLLSSTQCLFIMSMICQREQGGVEGKCFSGGSSM